MADLGQQDWLNDPRLARLFDAIEQAGGEARVAGGAVRNGLWGLPVKDIDVATTLLPDEVMAAGKTAGFGVHATGADHGTVTVVIDGLPVEVTTLRADMETDGRRAIVAYSKDWSVDAHRRDFTFNALYCDLTGRVYDETGQGLKDSRAKRVRFVGDADQRIREDYLRILRYFRFQAQYGQGEFDQPALAACTELKDGLKGLSVERIQAELLKIASGPGAVAVVEVMIAQGILPMVIKVDGSVEALAAMIDLENQIGVAGDAMRRLAMLTSDVSHLRLSKAQQQQFVQLNKFVNISPQAEEIYVKKQLYDLGVQGYRDMVMMAWIRTGAGRDDADWVKLYALADEWPVPVFPLSGKDMIAAGFTAGVEMGRVLKQLEQQWMDGGFSATKQDLLKEANKLKNR